MSEDNIDLIGGLLGEMEERYEFLEQGLDEAQRSITYNSYAMVITYGQDASVH